MGLGNNRVRVRVRVRVRFSFAQSKHAQTLKPAQPNPFKVGEYVLVENDTSKPRKTGEDKRDGPFKVHSVTDDTVTYESPQFPDRTFTAPIATVSRYTLRPGQNPNVIALRHNAKYYVPETILDHRPKKGIPTVRRTELLIKWTGFESEANTWEPVSNKTIRNLKLFRSYVRNHPELKRLLPKYP